MLPISLVVCLYQERDLLVRLLSEMEGLYDDLVVVHDGPEEPASDQPSSASTGARPPAIDYFQIGAGTHDSPYRQPEAPPTAGSIHELVVRHGGRFFEGPRCFQQEPHWPFAWSQAQHDWIFRLDADEFPSTSMKTWLQSFRAGPEPASDISGFTGIWPLWDGTRAVTRHWPPGRIFLIQRQRARFFGMAENTPVPDGHYQPSGLTLHHQPMRKSYGMRNVFCRKQAAAWRLVIATGLLGTPSDLPRWRWGSRDWPDFWKNLRERPLRTGIYSFVRGYLTTLRDQWRAGERILPWTSLAGPCHHLLIALCYCRLRLRSSTKS